MILIALMWARIPSAPYNFKRVIIKYKTFRTLFYGDCESVAALYSHLRPILGGDPFKGITLEQ